MSRRRRDRSEPDGPSSLPTDLTTAQKFALFHESNPEVYENLVAMARQTGSRVIGIGMLYEVLRWNHITSNTDDHSEFNLSNNYKPHYARLIMRQEPDLRGKFKIKPLFGQS